MRRKRDMPDQRDFAKLSNLARRLGAEGRFAEAETLCKRALAIAENVLGRHDPDIATILNNLAFIYHNQNRFAEAEPLYMRALAIREQAFGSEHPDVAQGLNNLAGLYLEQSRYG